MTRPQQVAAALAARGYTVTDDLPRGTLPAVARELGLPRERTASLLVTLRDRANAEIEAAVRLPLPEARTESECCHVWGCYRRASVFGAWSQFCKLHAPAGMLP